MALTRAALRELGVTEKEIIDNIMEAHGSGIEAAKEKATAAAESKAQKTIDDLQGRVDALPVDDGKNEWKEKHDKIKGEFDTYKINVENANIIAAKRAAARQALKALGAHDEDLDTFMLDKVDYDKVELDGDMVKNPKVFEVYKDQFKRYFGDVVTVGAGVATPPKGDGSRPNPFIQGEHFSLHAQTKLFKESPDLARSMAGAAGIKID